MSNNVNKNGLWPEADAVTLVLVLHCNGVSAGEHLVINSFLIFSSPLEMLTIIVVT